MTPQIKLLSNLVDLRKCEVFPSKLEKLRKKQKRKERFVFVNMICAMEDYRISSVPIPSLQ